MEPSFGRLRNHESHLSAVKRNGTTIESYLYDDQGMRIKKTSNGVSTYYINQFYEVTNGVATKYYYPSARSGHASTANATQRAPEKSQKRQHRHQELSPCSYPWHPLDSQTPIKKRDWANTTQSRSTLYPAR